MAPSPTTITGFLRSLGRHLDLPMRQHTADMFDAIKTALCTHQQERGPHPLLVLDDAEGLSVPIIDALRRLGAGQLDADDRLSILLSGTEHVLTTLRNPALASLRSRVVNAQALRPFSLEDTQNYVRFQFEYAQADAQLFSDDAIKHLFQHSRGIPRSINQLAVQALILAAVVGRDAIDGHFMAAQIATHPLYPATKGG